MTKYVNVQIDAKKCFILAVNFPFFAKQKILQQLIVLCHFTEYDVYKKLMKIDLFVFQSKRLTFHFLLK